MIRGSIFLTISPVTALILGIFISYLIDKLIPTGNYGIFSWFNIMNSILITVIPFQFPGAITRYLAVAKGGNNQNDINNLLKTSSVLALALVPVSGLVTLVVTPFVFNTFIGIGGQYGLLDVVILTVGVMCINLSAFSVSAMSGLQEFEKVGITQFIANILGQVVVIVMILYGFGIRALLFKWVVVGILTTVLLSFALRRIWSLQGRIYPLRPLIKFAYPVILSFLFAFFLQEFLIRFIFQSFSSSEELGLYAFAMRMFVFVNSLRLGFYRALSPYYAEAEGRGDAAVFEREVHWTMKISFFIFIPLFVGSTIIAPAFFLLFFENYYWSYQYFAVLMVGLFFSLFSTPYIAILNAKAKTQQILVISVISSVVSGVVMLLVMYYGVLFVSAGYVLLLVVATYASSWLFLAVFAGFWVKRIIGINLGIRRVLPFVIIAICMLFPAVLIHLLRLPPLIELTAIFSVCTLIYLIPIRIFRIVTANEIQKATLFLPKRLAAPLTKAIIWILTREKSEE